MEKRLHYQRLSLLPKWAVAVAILCTIGCDEDALDWTREDASMYGSVHSTPDHQPWNQ